jgi:hypothetical protein
MGAKLNHTQRYLRTKRRREYLDSRERERDRELRNCGENYIMRIFIICNEVLFGRSTVSVSNGFSVFRRLYLRPSPVPDRTTL